MSIMKGNDKSYIYLLISKKIYSVHIKFNAKVLQKSLLIFRKRLFSNDVLNANRNFIQDTCVFAKFAHRIAITAKV